MKVSGLGTTFLGALVSMFIIRKTPGYIPFITSEVIFWSSLFLTIVFAILFYIVLKKERTIKDKILKDMKNKLIPLVGLSITKAVYGANDIFEDVTKALCSYIRDNKLSLDVTNKLVAKDPVPGVVKTLIVEYSMNGTPLTRECKENEVIILP